MLKSRVAIVTGATSGIGLEIAKALAGEGCDLMIGGIASAGVPERVCQEISHENGVEVVYSDADLSKAEDARRMAADAIRAFGKVDILVNNAGLQFVAPLVDFPEERWAEVFGGGWIGNEGLEVSDRTLPCGISFDRR